MTARSVYLETFGCQMNELDSELVTGALRALGYRFVGEPDRADVVLYNTCSVREHAEQKVWSRLGIDKVRKLTRPGLVVGVLGCMAERDGEDLLRRMPQVDILCGPGELDKLPGLLDNAWRTRQSLMLERPESVVPGVSARSVALQGNSSRRSATLAAAEDTLELLDLSRAVSAGDHGASAYVRITRGCNKFCTYCVVPFTRGAEVHRPPDHIVDECKRLADAGVIEVTLLGQTVNHYRFEHGAAVSVAGITQPQKGRSYAGNGGGGHRRDPFESATTTTFADLLARIHDEVPGLRRLRFVTSYPRDFGDDVLEVIRDHPRICRYLHVPAQTGSDRLLKLMNRGYSLSEYLEFLDRARGFLHQPEKNRPLTIAGDIIVGFPTETDEDFSATVGLLERARYKNCFIFKYSPRPGTPAFDKLTDDVPEGIKRARNNHLLAVQTRISDEISREHLGKSLGVLVEGLSQKQVRRESALTAPRGTGTISITLAGRPLGSSARAAIESATRNEGFGEPGSGGPPPPPPPTSPSFPAPVQLSGRTDGDLIVFFHADTAAEADRLVGTIVPVRITSADGLSLHGQLEPGPEFR